MPIEIARLAFEAPREESDARDAPDAAQARPPDEEARESEPRNGDVRRSGHGPAGVPVFGGDGEPPVEVLDLREEGAPRRRASADDGSRGSIEKDRRLPPERDGGRFGRIGRHGDRRRRAPGGGRRGETEERAGAEGRGRRASVEPPRRPFDEAEHERLQREKDPGRAHRQDHDARDRARGQMAPEQGLPQGLHRMPRQSGLRLSLIINGSYRRPGRAVKGGAGARAAVA